MVVFQLVAFVCSSRAEYGEKIKYVIEQLKHEKTIDGVPLLEGQTVSYGGDHGAFYYLSQYIYRRASISDVDAMMKDECASIRVVAAWRIAQKHGSPIFRPEVLKRFVDDKAIVAIGPQSDGKFRKMTVADIAEELARDPEFLTKDRMKE